MRKMYRLSAFKWALVLAIMLAPVVLRGQTEATRWSETLTISLDSLLEAPMFERSQVAILVYDLDGDSVVYLSLIHI